jgi:DNA-binding response OmpR family regulator
MSGEQLAGILQQERPEMGVLLISGYSEQALDEERGFLAKPFTPRTLLARVRELIDARR